MTNQPTATEYPQIRTMFADALKAMAEGETEAEKQIVYVLNEARAALPCPAFVAAGISGSRHLFVMLGGKAMSIVQVFSRTPGAFEVSAPCADCFGVWTTDSGTLSLADGVLRALKASHGVIMQAAAEAGPKVRTEYNDGLVTRAEAVQMFSAGFADVSPGPVSREVAPGETIKGADVLADRARLGAPAPAPGPSAPENDPKVLRAAMSRAFEGIRGMRKEFGNPDSDYCAGVKEACDRIAAALVITE